MSFFTLRILPFLVDVVFLLISRVLIYHLMKQNPAKMFASVASWITIEIRKKFMQLW